MTQYGFYFDSTRCTGCKTCAMACKDYKDTQTEINFRKVYDIEGGSTTQSADGTVVHGALSYHVSLACNHCTAPSCVEVCPTAAMHKDADTGIVSVDATKCIGCGYCHMACPYNAPVVDREKGYSVKCDGCKDRISEGKQTICVEACPLRALDCDGVEALRKK
jgi:anaerobic dimethyl sulfoxide reductase subunit B